MKFKIKLNSSQSAAFFGEFPLGAAWLRSTVRSASSSAALLIPVLALAACSSDATATATGYAIQPSTTSAVAGDAVTFSVVQTLSDGTTAALPNGSSVTWTTPDTAATLPPDSEDDSLLPAAGDDPTAAFINNASRPDTASALSNVLFILDAGKQGGTVNVAATLSGVTPAPSLAASVAVSATPAGDAAHGRAVYAANCAVCHGDTGHGSADAGADGKFVIDGLKYDFPAPGLNAEPGNAAEDPAWNPGFFAVAARADFDDGDVSLRLPMPSWLVTPNGATHQLLTTQDFADMYAFLATQTQ